MQATTETGETSSDGTVPAAADSAVMPASYSRKVGERLRAIRRQKRLSLQEVEAASGQEFKASVLGAYERGERAISVPRLQRLARFYNVPVDQLLPNDDGPSFGTDESTTRLRLDATVRIDLRKLESLSGPEADMLNRYLTMIQVQRQDFNGRMLTIRRDDLRAIACILGVTVDTAGERLDNLGLKVEVAS
jgi:transcriptional regulator with XRE-family HTH domain